MINLNSQNNNFKKKFIYLLLILFLFINKDVQSSENKIIFKINDKAFTTFDYDMRVKYLDFVGSNNKLDKKVILDDYISVNLFYEYYRKSNNKKDVGIKVKEIYDNIEQTNKKNNKQYKYIIDKKNIISNIELDFIRKTVLENILKSRRDNLMISEEEIDLIYDLNLKYINFNTNNTDLIKKKINNLNNINYKNVISLLNKEKIQFFIQSKEIINIDKINKKIKENIIKNIDFFIFENKKDVSIIFIDKKFETFEGIVANLYSVKSEVELNKETLNCNNLLNNNKLNIFNKEYNFKDLNSQLKENLLNINDYVDFYNNNQHTYVVLCNLEFDKKILNNASFNKLINSNVNDIESKFINKYSKIFNLIKYE